MTLQKDTLIKCLTYVMVESVFSSKEILSQKVSGFTSLSYSCNVQIYTRMTEYSVHVHHCFPQYTDVPKQG